MKRWIAIGLRFCMFLACCPMTFGQGMTQSQSTTMGTSPPAAAATNTENQNIQEYINLLRTNVRQQKAEIMGSMMALDAQQAAKFWPIYSEYDTQLNKLNDQRVANIQDYARNYSQMTDAKADELVRNALDFRRQRSELLTEYYERVKAALGPIQAARFLQVEDQLLTIIDLKIQSALPIAGPSL